jgi:alpha-amylase/alpha-mannosidase (GH57 family)
VLTWADTDRDLTAWTGNEIQRDALNAIYYMEEDVMKTKKRDLIETWRKLQTSDHFYYMCTKWSNDGDVHAYFSPYQSPYDAYISFMNALSDLQLRVSQAVTEREQKKLAEDDTLIEKEGEKKETVTKTEKPDTVEIKETIPKATNWWNKILQKIPFLKL